MGILCESFRASRDVSEFVTVDVDESTRRGPHRSWRRGRASQRSTSFVPRLASLLTVSPTSIHSVRLTLVRHGQTDWNAARLVQGQSDESRLTERGEEEAREVARSLAGRHFDHVVSSDLERALATASIIAEELALAVVDSPLLRERSFGVLEGLPSTHLVSDATGIVGNTMTDPDARPMGGESFRDVVQRADTFIEFVDCSWPGSQLLVVTHGGMIRALLASWTGDALTDSAWGPVENCSVWAL